MAKLTQTIKEAGLVGTYLCSTDPFMKAIVGKGSKVVLEGWYKERKIWLTTPANRVQKNKTITSDFGKKGFAMVTANKFLLQLVEFRKEYGTKMSL